MYAPYVCGFAWSDVKWCIVAWCTHNAPRWQQFHMAPATNSPVSTPLWWMFKTILLQQVTRLVQHKKQQVTSEIKRSSILHGLHATFNSRIMSKPNLHKSVMMDHTHTRTLFLTPTPSLHIKLQKCIHTCSSLWGFFYICFEPLTPSSSITAIIIPTMTDSMLSTGWPTHQLVIYLEWPSPSSPMEILSELIQM